MAFLFVFSRLRLLSASAKVHDAVVLFLYLFRSGNRVYTRTKTFWVCSCRGLLNLWPWGDPATQKGPPSTPPSHREHRAHSPSWTAFSSHTPPGLPAEFQATHLARLLAPPPVQTQGFLSPRGQQCKAADGKLRVFNFLMRIVDLENSCYPRGHNTT